MGHWDQDVAKSQLLSLIFFKEVFFNFSISACQPPFLLKKAYNLKVGVILKQHG
jgi:hypothetical protein